jgi:prepilin-type N-terminal cleavage/methylation domain-containing protein
MREQHGFSLVEALIVCTVASILMTMAIPIFNTTMERSNADAAAQLIAQELNFARALAVATHGNILAQFDTSSNSVVVAAGTGSARGPFILPGRVKILTAAPSPDTPDSLGHTVLGSADKNQITFLDNGAAATDGTGTVLCSGTFFLEHKLGDPATLRAVTLLGGTGRARVWRYDPNTTSWK